MLYACFHFIITCVRTHLFQNTFETSKPKHPLNPQSPLEYILWNISARIFTSEKFFPNNYPLSALKCLTLTFGNYLDESSSAAIYPEKR